MNKFNSKVNDYCLAHLKKIDKSELKYGDYSFDNQRCHHNAVAAARSGRADSVYLVIAGNSAGLVVHFINKKEDKYFDETWHEYDNDPKYFIIREITESEYANISDILMATKRLMTNMFGSYVDKFKMNWMNKYDI